MKILQINKFYYLRGGAERYVFELSKILKEKGHIVTPFSMRDSRNESTSYEKYFINKVEVNKFSFKNIIKIFYNYDAVKKLKKLIKEEKPDIAHLHNIDYQISASTINVLKKYNIPIMQTLHDYKLVCPNKKLFSRSEICEKCLGGKYYNCLFRKCSKNSLLKSFLAVLEQYWSNKILKSYDKVDLFIAPSEFMKNIMVRFSVPEGKIKVIYNPTSPPAPLPASPAGGLVRRGGKGEDDYLLYFGRLAKEKGIEVLLEAMKKVESDVKLKIVGAGEEYENFKFQISNFKLNYKVELAGPKYGEELRGLIKNAKAIILPSLWYENMPMSLLEAMSAGKVVIASRLGGLTEIIKDGESGFLFNPGDTQDLAEKIDSLAAFDFDKISKRAAEDVLKLNILNHYAKILEIYNNLAKR